MGNTIQVRLGALTIPLVAFWLKRVLGSRDCPQVGKVLCSFFNRPPTLASWVQLSGRVIVLLKQYVPTGKESIVLGACSFGCIEQPGISWCSELA